MADTDASNNQRIRQVVLAIPAGQVATYGTIAEKAGLGRAVSAMLCINCQQTLVFPGTGW
jgi:alkylated DNA nucleotide flippase Atl1